MVLSEKNHSALFLDLTPWTGPSTQWRPETCQAEGPDRGMMEDRMEGGRRSPNIFFNLQSETSSTALVAFWVCIYWISDGLRLFKNKSTTAISFPARRPRKFAHDLSPSQRFKN